LNWLETHNSIEEIAGLSYLRTDLGVSMLSKRNGWIITLVHVLMDILEEEVRSEERCLLRRFDVRFVNCVLVVVLLSALGAPSLHRDEVIVEQLIAVNCDELAIIIIGNTATIVCLGNQVADGLPWDWLVGLEVGVLDTLLVAAHVQGECVLADLVVRIIETVGNVPTKRLELLTFNKNGVEPHETVDSLAELHVLLALCESFAHVLVHAHRIGFDATRRLYSRLD